MWLQHTVAIAKTARMPTIQELKLFSFFAPVMYTKGLHFLSNCPVVCWSELSPELKFPSSLPPWKRETDGQQGTFYQIYFLTADFDLRSCSCSWHPPCISNPVLMTVLMIGVSSPWLYPPTIHLCISPQGFGHSHCSVWCSFQFFPHTSHFRLWRFLGWIVIICSSDSFSSLVNIF